MTEIVIKVQDESEVDFLFQLLRGFDFVAAVNVKPEAQRETAEQAFIDGRINRAEAEAILGSEHVVELAYAMEALAADVALGLA